MTYYCTFIYYQSLLSITTHGMRFQASRNTGVHCYDYYYHVCVQMMYVTYDVRDICMSIHAMLPLL